MCVLTVKKSFLDKDCPTGLVFGGEYLLCVSFSRTVPGPQLPNLRTFPGQGIFFLIPGLFTVLPDPWEP